MGRRCSAPAVPISRRAFIAYGASLALAGVSAPALARFGSGAAAYAGGTAAPLEATIGDLQRAMGTGTTSSVAITRAYLRRIEEFNPLLHAVIETNPDALAIAGRLDRERRAGHVRGPLHGIPVLVKDNIATADGMRTTAGSLALVDAEVGDDAVVTKRLRRAGAVILGKANLSEWANMRGGSDAAPPVDGWSARGGFTRNPYVLSATPLGSSSGSAVGVAANLAVVAVGTETDGSITAPAGITNVVGLKPTVGLVSQIGVIPIAASQDAAGPLARTVTDAAILLGVLQSPSPAAGLTPAEHLPRDYTAFLDPRALRGARLGIDPQFLDAERQGVPKEEAALLDIRAAVGTLRRAGAVIVEHVDTGDVKEYAHDEETLLLFEFKAQIADYLAGLRSTRVRSLADLIAFNRKHCEDELRYFGQEVFEAADATSGDLQDPTYLAARDRARRFTRSHIDRAFDQHRLDAVIGPSFGAISSPAAVAGYPHVTVPAGFDPAGRPIGLSFFARPWQEGKLLGLAYAFEQVADAREAPGFRGEVPAEPARFDGCRRNDTVRAAHAPARLRPPLRL